MSLLKLILLDGHLLYGLKNPSTLFCKKDKSLLYFYCLLDIFSNLKDLYFIFQQNLFYLFKNSFAEDILTNFISKIMNNLS